MPPNLYAVVSINLCYTDEILRSSHSHRAMAPTATSTHVDALITSLRSGEKPSDRMNAAINWSMMDQLIAALDRPSPSMVARCRLRSNLHAIHPFFRGGTSC